jgi:biotin carboxyl carrier protein
MGTSVVGQFTFTVDGVQYQIRLEGTTVWVDGAPYSFRDSGSQIEIDGTPYAIDISEGVVTLDGAPHRVELRALEPAPPDREVTRSKPEAGSEGCIRAVMPGRVIDIRVREGQRIEKGAVVLVLEAMKMENEVAADRSGEVKEIRVAIGSSVEVNEILAVIE